MKKEQSIISVWTDEERSPSKASIPRMADITRHVADVSADVISSNIEKFLRTFEPVLERAASAASKFEIDEIELSLVVNGKGGVELLGKVEAGAQASIKVKLKRKSHSEGSS